MISTKKSDFYRNTQNTSDDILITILEVTEVINAQNHKKAPGVDGITADIIRFLHNIDANVFTNLYNKCLEIECFPDIWKQSVVKVIPKHNKTDYTVSDAYRPISLLPVFGKIYEKLLINRITYHLRTTGAINERQYGFTAQKSTEQALHSVVDFIQNGFKRKGFSLVISLDISGAFN